ncbi:DUF7344 domain-containing protein [Halococcus morrhuae]|uniref:DUF7344 domain-containing protein n=1 Tax=Halococcus morrhuae TaxID=2250 RepID=UPI003F824B9A
MAPRTGRYDGRNHQRCNVEQASTRERGRDRAGELPMVRLPLSPNGIVEHLQRPISATELSEFLSLLSNRRRCLVIISVFTLGPDETVDLRTLSQQIAHVETTKDPSEVTSDDRQTVYNNLHQNHLEQLADANMIEYEEDRKLVGRGSETTIAGIVLAAVVVILQFLRPRSRDSS